MEQYHWLISDWNTWKPIRCRNLYWPLWGRGWHWVGCVELNLGNVFGDELWSSKLLYIICNHKRIFSFNAEFICTRVFLKNLKLYLPKFWYFVKSTLLQINSKLNSKSIPIRIICSYLTWGLQTCKKIDVQWHDFFCS